MTRTSRGALIVQSVETGPDSGSPGYVELKVITERAGDKTEFTLFCNGVEFSTVAHGDGVFDTVARHIVGLRRHKGRYPIYITEIDLSGIVGAEERTASPRTLHYLSYKKRIEARLNQALAGL